MNEVTTIDSNGFTIVSAKDETINGLAFKGNKKISFLPVDIYENFPNLEILNACDCSIKSIFKENFRYLNKLEDLDLNKNQIETIRADVFENSLSIKRFWFRKNNFFYYLALTDFLSFI